MPDLDTSKHGRKLSCWLSESSSPPSSTLTAVFTGGLEINLLNQHFAARKFTIKIHQFQRTFLWNLWAAALKRRGTQWSGRRLILRGVPSHNICRTMTGGRHGGSRLIDSHLGVCHLTTVTFLTCHRPYEKVTPCCTNESSDFTTARLRVNSRIEQKCTFFFR